MHETMTIPVGARALGLAQNDPLRGPVALTTLAKLFSLPHDADGAGVATVVDGASLLSRVKFGATAPSLAIVVGTPKGRTAVVQLGVRRELRPQTADQTANLGPFRARTFAAAVVGGPQDPDEAAAARDRLLATLPDSLRRCLVGKSEGEAFFLAVLARLHQQGTLDRPDNGPWLVDAVRAVDDNIAWPRQVTITNGSDVLHVARGMPSAIVVVSGLADSVADSVSPLLADSSTARERNRRYHGTFCVGGLEEQLKASTPVPAGCTLHVLPDQGAVLVGREPHPRLL